MAYAVTQPAGCSRQADTARTDWEREDFTDDDPGARTPSGGKEEDVNENESNQAPDCVLVIGERNTDRSNWQTTIPAAPQMSIVRRPYFSTIQKEIGVEQILINVNTRDIRATLLIVRRGFRNIVE